MISGMRDMRQALLGDTILVTTPAVPLPKWYLQNQSIKQTVRDGEGW